MARKRAKQETKINKQISREAKAKRHPKEKAERERDAPGMRTARCRDREEVGWETNDRLKRAADLGDSTPTADT